MSRNCFFVLSLFGILLVSAFPTAHAEEKLDRDLVYEATLGSAERVKLLLTQGASPNAVNPEGWTALAIAANRIDEESLPIVTLLVEAGADVDNQSSGYPPIINAARNSQIGVVSYLLDKGADPRTRDHNGKDLIWISHHVREPELKRLVEQIFEKEKAREAAMRSEENLKKLVKDYSYALCEAKYWTFYVASNQDPEMDKETLKTHINNRLRDANSAHRDLYRYFPSLDIAGFQRATAGSQYLVQKQLEALVSNRNRRKHGVGTVEDMAERCTPIAERWKVSLKTPKQ